MIAREQYPAAYEVSPALVAFEDAQARLIRGRVGAVGCRSADCYGCCVWMRRRGRSRRRGNPPLSHHQHLIVLVQLRTLESRTFHPQHHSPHNADDVHVGHDDPSTSLIDLPRIAQAYLQTTLYAT
jgi:hypothetical protein